MLEQPTIQGSEPETGEEETPSAQMPKSPLPMWGVAGRFAVLLAMMLIIIYSLSLGLRYDDNFVVYSTLMPVHQLLVFIVAWLFYRGTATGGLSNELVTVIIPIYNQRTLIERVVEAVYASTYDNLEVVAVDDGSRDGTGDLLDELKLRHPEMNVIHKVNGGKRTAVATGFYNSRGKIVVLIDSDSILDKNAIAEIVKTLAANPRAGGVVGDGKVWNRDDNLLTICQSAWYDYSFNIHKKCESFFGTVLCCSGCLAAYRREAIIDYIPYWTDSDMQYGDDRNLTAYAIAEPWAKREMAPISQRLKEAMSRYDDSEDRGLTAQTMESWETLYVPTAVVYTDVPKTLKKFFRQQLRWKKGYLRTNFYVSAFFWRKKPLIALIYYLELMSTFTSPIITLIVLLYGPLVLHDYVLPLTFILGQALVGFAAGMDRRARERDTAHLIINPVWNVFVSLVLIWVIVPALLTLKENKWLTR